MQIPQSQQVIINRLEQLIHEGKLTTPALVQIIELCLLYTNSSSASEYARKRGISYQAAIKPTNHKIIHKIGGVPFCFEC